jgi:hypothetical protein
MKYLINKNHCILILINTKNCTNYCWMLGNFFRRSADHKQGVNKKQKLPSTCKLETGVAIESAAPSGGQENYMLASFGVR